MTDQANAIQKFRDVTDVDEEQAKAFLEAANNDLELAFHHFFGEHGMEEVINLGDDDDDDDEETSGASKGSEGRRSNTDDTKSKGSSNRFQTVSGLNHDSSSDDDEGGQAFFAGGSVHSGQQVLGPKSRNQIVDEMFRSVKEHGGEVVNQEAGSIKPTTLKFSGTGYRLGQTNNDTEVVSTGETSRGRQEVTITLRMWRQGFSVNDGPLRKYTEPQNVQFLKTVSRGVIPDELLREAQGNEVHLNMEDHSHEDYSLAKPKLKAFSGKGNVLGSPVPGAVVTPAQPLAKTSPNDRAACEGKAREVVPLDSSQPTTSVQIRLADGSRLVGSFNHSHTLADLRTYIATARPEYANTSFHLLTTFPSKELTDDSSTLADAGILNAALLQRIG